LDITTSFKHLTITGIFLNILYKYSSKSIFGIHESYPLLEPILSGVHDNITDFPYFMLIIDIENNNLPNIPPPYDGRG